MIGKNIECAQNRERGGMEVGEGHRECATGAMDFVQDNSNGIAKVPKILPSSWTRKRAIPELRQLPRADCSADQK